MSDIITSDCHIPDCHYFYDYTTHQADASFRTEVAATATKEQIADVVVLKVCLRNENGKRIAPAIIGLDTEKAAMMWFNY